MAVKLGTLRAADGGPQWTACDVWDTERMLITNKDCITVVLRCTASQLHSFHGHSHRKNNM